MNDERTATTPTPPTVSVLPTANLSADELWRLTLYKWRYSLEAKGFTGEQTRHLLFLKWLYSRGTARR